MNRNLRYGNKIIGKNVSFTMDTWESGHNNNVICVAGSGHGKTTGFVQPNLAEANCSMVVADTKGQLSRRYTKMLREKGFYVETLDFANLTHNRVGYNPLRYIERYADGSVNEKDVMTVAYVLEGQLDNREPFWDKSAEGYIAFLVAYVLESDIPESEKTLCTVAKLHNAYIQRNGSKPFLNWVKEHPTSFAARKFYEIESSRPADKTFSCIMSFATTALQCLSFREAAYLFENPIGGEFDLHSIGQRKTILFVNTSDTDFTFEKLSGLLYTQLFQTLTKDADANPDGTLNVPVDIYLDDFCSSASSIKDFDRIISVIRSRDISVNLMIQSLKQLQTMYDKDKADTIVDNCDTILYMGCNSPETARFVGARASKTPESILCGLPRDKEWVLQSGQKARMVDKITPADYNIPEVCDTSEDYGFENDFEYVDDCIDDDYIFFTDDDGIPFN